MVVSVTRSEVVLMWVLYIPVVNMRAQSLQTCTAENTSEARTASQQQHDSRRMYFAAQTEDRSHARIGSLLRALINVG